MPFGGLNDVLLNFVGKTPQKLKFLSFRLESPIHTPQNLCFWGVLPTKFRVTSFRPPKGTSLRDFTSFEVGRVKIYPRVWPVREPERKKGINKNNFCYILPICPEALSWWICNKFGVGCPLADVINCACRIFYSISSGVSILCGLKFAYSHRN